MCTVTILPLADRLLICSSRDERHDRLPALLPAVYSMGKHQLLFPKDANAGGTWIAAVESGNAGILLNGAWKPHVHQPPYGKSRGIILLDILRGNAPLETFDHTNLKDIEPFTVILLDQFRLYDCRWDGEMKSLVELDATKPHIWSSVTLYDQYASEKRTSWFHDWLSQHPNPTLADLQHFHETAGAGDRENDINMRRKDLATVSITSMEVSSAGTVMNYLDLRSGQTSRIQFNLSPSTIPKL